MSQQPHTFIQPYTSSYCIRETDNLNDKHVSGYNTEIVYKDEGSLESVRYQVKQRANAELQLTPLRTFWISFFLARGKIIEEYNGYSTFK